MFSQWGVILPHGHYDVHFLPAPGLIEMCGDGGWVCSGSVSWGVPSNFFPWSQRVQCRGPQRTKCHSWCVFRQPQTTDLTPANTVNQCQSGYQMVTTKPYWPQIQTNSAEPQLCLLTAASNIWAGGCCGLMGHTSEAHAHTLAIISLPMTLSKRHLNYLRFIVSELKQSHPVCVFFTPALRS